MPANIAELYMHNAMPAVPPLNAESVNATGLPSHFGYRRLPRIDD